MRNAAVGGLVALCLGALPVRAEPVDLTGIIAYREGMMLPPAAVTTVRLVERDAPEVTVAEATVADRRAPPIPFTLTYDDGLIDPAKGYALDVRIGVGEQVLFANDEPRPLADPTTSRNISIVVRLQRPGG